MISDKWSFLSINVKRIKASEKRLKLFEYFENWSTVVVFIFLEEKFLWSRHKVLWNWKSFELLNKFDDKSLCVLVIEVKVENEQ